MQIKYVQNGSTNSRSNLTLAEQTRDRLYIDNEDDSSREAERINGAELSEVQGCKKIGFIQFDAEEVEDIEDRRIPEPIAECVFLQGISYAEQQENRVYVEFTDGEISTFSGELDRAYTY